MSEAPNGEPSPPRAAAAAAADGGSGGPPRGYFATTCSRGIQRMASEEMQLRLQASNVRAAAGKVFFDTELPATAPEFRSMRSIERTFINLQHLNRESGKIDLPGDPAEAINMLQKAFVDDVPWEAAMKWWHDFTGTPAVAGADAEPLTFKVRCNKSGTRANHIKSEEVAGRVGRVLRERFGWKVDLKHGQIEVFLYVADDAWTAGLAVLRQAVTASGHITNPGLHPTVSWAIARAGGIQAGDVVCDPMCGKGVILVEAARHWPTATYLGVDIEREYLDLGVGNLTSAGVSNRVSLAHGSCTRLPVRAASVDVLLCDLPFGKMFGSVDGNRELYPKMLAEAARAVRPGGRAVLLTSDSNGELMEAQVGEDGVQVKEGRWQLVAKHPVKIGFKMPTHIYLLYRLGLGEAHLTEVVKSLGLKGSGWDVVTGKRSWRKRWLADRPEMEGI